MRITPQCYGELTKQLLGIQSKLVILLEVSKKRKIKNNKSKWIIVKIIKKMHTTHTLRFTFTRCRCVLNYMWKKLCYCYYCCSYCCVYGVCSSSCGTKTMKHCCCDRRPRSLNHKTHFHVQYSICMDALSPHDPIAMPATTHNLPLNYSVMQITNIPPNLHNTIKQYLLIHIFACFQWTGFAP